MKPIEKNYRLDEAAQLCGYKISTLRKKIKRKEVGYRRMGRLLTIPASELAKLVGELHGPAA